MAVDRKKIISDLIEQAQRFRFCGPSDDPDEQTAVTVGYRHLVVQIKRFVCPILPNEAASRLNSINVDWDDDNIFHEFTPEEVEEVFAGDHKVRRTRQQRYTALGETLDGRLAFVVFRRLSGGLVRVITARDMDASERRLFRRK